ncbi:hypothetical protein EDI_120210 [Entamoeba dispar SAW760]|uniref:Uncharacterized protein n=1 Tax=Entamoeba dispar (strain ATCC PRA-260 / SAW760) TaxID=370354 RepID=B0EAM1_ENTDS|nr:uncharacterized protein EDI_120210 [Entamoeba dispar SAW760]EDR28417.1 hypothetical protein EDI_120210 [Entamoeba dispar SAW760]|eukprot:EDR28417.1 hypothetical protein EDI_120210 [Entamoeba dispar SAW760]
MDWIGYYILGVTTAIIVVFLMIVTFLTWLFISRCWKNKYTESEIPNDPFAEVNYTAVQEDDDLPLNGNVFKIKENLFKKTNIVEMSLIDKMNSDEYEMVLITYPRSYDISKIKQLTYNSKGKKNTVVPMEKTSYQNVIPLVNNKKKMSVSKPFVDGFEVIIPGENEEPEKEEDIDFFHSTKEPKYHFVDWRNITVQSKPEWLTLCKKSEPSLTKQKEVKQKKLSKTEPKKESLSEKIKRRNTKISSSSSSSSDSE